MKLKLMGYNLRCGNDKNGHSIPERAPRIFDIMKDYDPDICGFQEVTPMWMEELKALDDRFDHILMYRHPTSSEGTPIFWRKDRYELVEKEHFWLSDTPTVPSKMPNDHYYRVCSYAALRHKETGKVLHLFNTHFSGGDRTGRESAQLIIRKAEKLGDVPVLCTADFNFKPGSAGWHSMRSWFGCVRETVAPDNNLLTGNGYVRYGEDVRWIIDFCFYHGTGVIPEKYEVITRLYDGKFPSDHYGMYYEFDIKE